MSRQLLKVHACCNVSKVHQEIQSFDFLFQNVSPFPTTRANKKERIHLRFDERKRRLNKACLKHRQSIPNHVPRLVQISTSLQRNVTMCAIAKCASRFWDKVIYKMDHHVEHPDLSTTSMERGARDGQNVVFVRNPYVRLLSAYLDKFYAVNPIFWKTIGPFVLGRTRYLGRAAPAQCAHDVSFEEFVDYVLYLYENGFEIEVHFAPIHIQCGFCEIGYDYIGKIETLNEDSRFVVENVLDAKFAYNLQEEIKLNIKGNSRALFHQRRADMEQCGVSLNQGLRRTWKRWQIRGLISPSIPFPLKANETVSYREFEVLALKAHINSKPNDLRQGKEAALREAFSSLSHVTKKRLQRMYGPEFDMFHYNPSPDFVFGKHSHQQNFSFFTDK